MPRITITEPGKPPQPYRFDLATEEVKIGRRSENEIILKCGSVSGSHAEMVRVPGGFELRDLGSTNGIIKDDKRIEIWSLSDGDRLFLGDTEFDFQLNEEELMTLAAEVDPKRDVEKQGFNEAKEEMAEAPKPSIFAAIRSLFAGFHGIPNWVVIVVFLILGSIAFFNGMSKRHKIETGVTIGEIVMRKLSTPDMSRVKTQVAGDLQDDALAPAANGNAEAPASVPAADEPNVKTDASESPEYDPFGIPVTEDEPETSVEDLFALTDTTTEPEVDEEPEATGTKKNTESDSDEWDNWDDWDLAPEE